MGSKTDNNAKTSFDRLAAINRAITTTLNFNEALVLIVDNGTELFSADNSLLLLAEDDGILRVRAAHAGNEITSRFAGPMEESVIRDLARDLKLKPEQELVTVPIVAHGSLSGFLAIVRESLLTAEEQWQLSALGDQAAIALNNARLHEFQTGEAIRQRDESLAALRESSRKITNILESITDLYYQLDREWRFTDINRQTVARFGRSREELLGKVIWEVFPAAVESDLYPALRKCSETMVPAHFELGSPVVQCAWFEVHAYPTRAGLSVYLRDITERRKSEGEITFQSRLLSAVEQAVIATDLEGTIVYWNSFAEQLYGWSSAEALGANVLEITPADAMLEQAAEIRTPLTAGKSCSGEFLVRRKDGTVFPAMVTDSPIFSDQGELIGIVGVSVDISQRKQSEAEREVLHQSERSARAEAEKAIRLKDEFLATLSHELRNPLNVILGYAEVLLRSDEARTSQFVRKAAEVLKRNALAQSRLVRDLLDLSRLHIAKLSLNCEAVSLTTLIDNAVETVSGEAAHKQIDIKIDGAEDVIFVNADPLRLEQVVWNLLNNAVKFTPVGGTVTIRLGSEQGRATIIVADTGPGVEPQFLPHVFEMFRQADASSSRPHGGMGIGLALLKQLIELHGGSVAAASTLGQGATFTIELPATAEKEESPGYSPQAEPGILSHMRILIVDDSADTVEMLRRLVVNGGGARASASGRTHAHPNCGPKKFYSGLSENSLAGRVRFFILRRLPGLC